MKTSPRRAFSAILAAALLLGSVPEGAQAQVMRVVAGETGVMPVSPVNGVNAVSNMTPALNIGGASLTGTFFAPSIALSPVIGAAAVSADGKTAANAAVVSALTAVPLAAASEEKPELPANAPKANEPVKTKTLGERLFGWLKPNKTAEAPAQEKTTNAEKVKTDADTLFDGSTEKESAPEGAPVTAGTIQNTRTTGLKAFIAKRVGLAAAKRRLHVDEFGGPLAQPMTFKQRLGYGFKQGLHMIGVAAILEVTLRPFLSLFPWPQYLSDGALSGFGRVALLTHYGPNEIVSGLANAPGTFLGIGLPIAVTMEEITYRLLGFGLTFLVLAAIRPLTRWAASMIKDLPNAAGVVSGSQRLLKIGEWISRFAFPIAAVLSSFNFAVAHFATWGISPFVLGLNFALGLFLAHTAYKSRGLTAPIVAHLVFNLVTFGAILVAMAVSPLAAAAFVIIAGLIGVSTLLHSWLTARKERAFRLKNGLFSATVVALMLAGLAGTTLHAPNAPASRQTVAAAMERVQAHRTEGGVKLGPPGVVADSTKAAPADTTVIESREDMVARVKPAVVNPIIHMGDGYALGSGFILTPNGVFITNGHVVGTKRPGEFINVRVPGFPNELSAKVLAVNHDKDLAIVQIEPRPDGKPWPTVKLSADTIREGQDVTALGYPRGLGFSVSHGVVSGMDGRGTMYVKFLQTDAAINPGNSGGPLFNAKGEVIGVNTQIYTQSGGSEGLGFSILAPEVAQIMNQYAKTGNIATASIGIIANLSDPQIPEAGLEIEYTRGGSAAEKAGLLRGDLIVGVGDEVITEGGAEAAGHIAAVLSKMTPGQQVKIVVIRGDEPVELTLTTDAKITTAPKH